MELTDRNCNHCNHNFSQITSLKWCVCHKVLYCNVKCQRADWKNHRQDCPPFVIKDSPGKGKGIFTTRNLKVGSLILEEEPLMLIDAPLVFTDFKVAFRKLTDKQKKLVLSLHGMEKFDEKGDDVCKALGIFAGNSISVLGDDNMERALYYNISRINHSCSPNAIWSWKKGDMKVKQVRACSNIAAGEEVLASYIGRTYYFGQRNHRRASLRENWGFDCYCKLCTLTGEDLSINEKIREEIGKHHELVPAYLCKYKHTNALKSACKKVELIRKIRGEMEMELQSALLECYELAFCMKSLGIKVNPKTMGECVTKHEDEYKTEALSILEKLHLDCLWGNFDKKMLTIKQKCGL